MAVVMLSFTVMGNSSNSFEKIIEEEQALDIHEIYPPKDFNYEIYYYIEKLASELKINPEDLFQLIYFETAGTMNPKIENPKSSAKGLIQFTDASSRKLKDSSGSKYISSFDLITKCGTVECQLSTPSRNNNLGGPVYQYLRKFKNLNTKEKLFMAVFYPNAIGKGDYEFSKEISELNSGISKVSDYVKQADARMPKKDGFND